MDYHDLSDRRRNYEMGSFSESQTHRNPMIMFRKWFDDATSANIQEPNAMALATAGHDGKPSVRMVLLKSFDAAGFTFYTNYESKKGRQLTENPNAALLFFWDILERQIRIEGTISKVPDETAGKYFLSRPPESRIAAVVSQQSRVVSREELVQKFEKMKMDFPDGNIPKPDYWGGYLLTPVLFEFWQGRPGRLHDRIQYSKTDQNHWAIERLAP